jgi:signal peptidase II
MSTRYRLQVLGVVAVACVVADLLTKALAVRMLAGQVDRSFFWGALRLQYMENRGAFLSLGASLPPVVRTGIFVLAVAAILVVLMIYVVRSPDVARAELWATSLFVGGGLGNLVDRIWLGYVRDFANVGIGSLRTGVFNVADMAISAGAVLLVIHLSRNWKKQR